MKNIHSVPLRAAALMVGCALSVLAAPAFAASTWSNLGTIVTTPTGSGCKTAGTAMGNVADCGAGVITGGTASVTMKADGFSTAAGTVAAPTAGTTFAAASVRQYGSAGMGLVNKAETDATGPHAADNNIGTDALRLTFSKQMTLSQVSIGWNGSDNFSADSDITVLAWVGPGSAPGAVNSKTLQTPASAASTASVATAQAASTLLTSGWVLVKNFSDVGLSNGNESTAVGVAAKASAAGGAATIPAAPAIYSSYWLISAYNTTFGGNWTTGNDYFKLTGIVGTTNNIPTGKVPEPGSLALIGAALAGMLALRRRRLATA